MAVKRLTTVTHEERITSFLSELGIIAHVDHRNTAKLIGYGVERGLYIVLELSSLGSLGSLLHRKSGIPSICLKYNGKKNLYKGFSYIVFFLVLTGSSEILDWGTRYKISLGVADGLLYLHEGCQRRIIHRDIKADNILLTENYEAQVFCGLHI